MFEPWFPIEVCYWNFFGGRERTQVSELLVRFRNFLECYNTAWRLRMLRLWLPALGLLVAWLVRLACHCLA